MNSKELAGKSLLFIIAKENFRDEEYDTPCSILKEAGASITVASSAKGECRSMLGSVTAVAEVAVDEADVSKHDGVVFVGGTGSSEYFDNPSAHRIASQAFGEGKIVAAICIAPVTLARAGILKDCKVTCFPSVEEQVESGGAECTGAEVEKEGRIITGKGPEAAAPFARAIKEALLSPPV